MKLVDDFPDSRQVPARWRLASTSCRDSRRNWRKGTVMMKLKRLTLYGGILLAFTVGIIYLHNRISSTNEIYSIPGMYNQDEQPLLKAYDLVFPSRPYNWYIENCYKNSNLHGRGRSISNVYKRLTLLRASSNNECKNISDIFDMMFTFEENVGQLVLPEQFQFQVLKWFDYKNQLYKQMSNQKVYKIINKWTFEETVYNPLSSKRTTSITETDVNPEKYIHNLTLSTEKTCHFCSYKSLTASDVFGRIDNKYSASASNTFKLSKFHGLFFPKVHNPLKINLPVLLDLLLNTSVQWFQKAYRTDPKQKYPTLLWDSLPHAGASQIHPHLHGILGEHQYAGLMESMHNVADRYYNLHKRSYWTDYILLHSALGLAVRQPNAVLIVPLNSRKDHEYMILSPMINKDSVLLLYKIIEGYKNTLGVFCWSGGGVYPVMDNAKTGLPMLFRIGARGDCTSISSDVSSLELYTVNSISSDLDLTISSVQNTTAFDLPTTELYI